MKKDKGFTLIELLIVIAIIAILAVVAFVALDPLTRFQDARDSSRWSDVNALISAVKIDQIDNGGSYMWHVATSTAGTAYMISTGTTTSGCNTETCADQTISATDDCVNFSQFVDDGYLASVPVSPNGTGSWSASSTGYYMIRNSTGSLTIGACESENTSAISVSR